MLQHSDPHWHPGLADTASATQPHPSYYDLRIALPLQIMVGVSCKPAWNSFVFRNRATMFKPFTCATKYSTFHADLHEAQA